VSSHCLHSRLNTLAPYVLDVLGISNEPVENRPKSHEGPVFNRLSGDLYLAHFLLYLVRDSRRAHLGYAANQNKVMEYIDKLAIGLALCCKVEARSPFVPRHYGYRDCLERKLDLPL
jgi:hypothetical protein